MLHGSLFLEDKGHFSISTYQSTKLEGLSLNQRCRIKEVTKYDYYINTFHQSLGMYLHDDSLKSSTCNEDLNRSNMKNVGQ